MSLLTSLPFLKNRTSVPRQIMSESWNDRRKITNADVNLFCWCRSIDPAIKRFVKAAIDHEPAPIRCLVDVDNVREQLEAARMMWDDSSDGKIFWQDVSVIVRDFLCFSNNGRGVMHVRVVSNDACTKFHVDGYSLRLFTTYYGPGTEWLPEEAVNRAALGTRNDDIVRDERNVRRIETGHVSILKGEIPGRASSVKGIVHRSPAITHTNEKRVILRIDI